MLCVRGRGRRVSRCYFKGPRQRVGYYFNIVNQTVLNTDGGTKRCVVDTQKYAHKWKWGIKRQYLDQDTGFSKEGKNCWEEKTGVGNSKTKVINYTKGGNVWFGWNIIFMSKNVRGHGWLKERLILHQEPANKSSAAWRTQEGWHSVILDVLRNILNKVDMLGEEDNLDTSWTHSMFVQLCYWTWFLIAMANKHNTSSVYCTNTDLFIQ